MPPWPMPPSDASGVGLLQGARATHRWWKYQRLVDPSCGKKGEIRL